MYITMYIVNIENECARLSTRENQMNVYTTVLTGENIRMKMLYA